MKSDPHVKEFDCVAYMREARHRISAEISGMSHEEVRRWASRGTREDTALGKLLAHFDESTEREADKVSRRV